MKTVLKNAAIYFFLSLALALLTSQADAYNVSGIVEFSYRNYETKTGSARSSDQQWSQYYKANLQNYFLDPRAIQYTLGIGYRVDDSAHGQGSKSLDYNFSTSLFPGMKYSADFFVAKSTTTVQSDSTIAGYDILSTQYGGTVYLNLSRGIRNGRNNSSSNNNNNNNNNNNFKKSWQMPLPDITLSSTHTESESLSSDSPRHETLDKTQAALNFHPVSSTKLDLTAGLEKYKNLEDSSAYDTTTVNLDATTQVTRNADLKINGNLTDRTTKNMSGFDSSSLATTMNAQLDFKEKNSIRHYYSYNFYDMQSSSVFSSYQTAAAGMTYKINEYLSATGGLKYTIANYVTKATDSTPEQDSTLSSGGAEAGVSYKKIYTPEFLGPFSFLTDYTFGYGFARYTSNISGQQTGSGIYYTNAADMGFNSKDWKQENLSLYASYSNKRDSSTLQNNSEVESLKFNFLSRRVTRTTLRATAAYQEQRYASLVLSMVEANQTTSNRGRSFSYDLGADYTPTYYLTLSTGLSRQKSNTSTEYTISTLTSSSETQTDDDVIYGAAKFNYTLTRNLQFRSDLRDEYRHSSTTRTQVYLLDTYLDYRIRQILVSVQYRWRQDSPNNADRTEQQLFYVKLSRPF